VLFVGSQNWEKGGRGAGGVATATRWYDVGSWPKVATEPVQLGSRLTKILVGGRTSSNKLGFQLGQE